jgi:hypothetical protein
LPSLFTPANGSQICSEDDMRLVDNARNAWKWFSVQALAALGVIPVVWYALPPEAQEIVPEHLRPWALTIVALAGLSGRLVKQEGKP